MTVETGVLVETRLDSTPSRSSGFITSKDGTTLGYSQVGHGPALVLLHGTMVAARDFTQLSDALADTFTVYSLDRRGRGLSGPYLRGHGMAQEVEDLAALCARTGARNVFAVSLGGLIALQAALAGLDVDKMALYEPALLGDAAPWLAQIDRYDREMREGRVADALVTSLKVTRIGGPMMDLLPRSLVVRMTLKAMAAEDARAHPGDVTMRRLAPTFHYDARLILSAAGKAQTLRAVRVPVLLLGGTRSPRWLRSALDSAARVLPNAQRVVFPGLNHGGATNVSMMNRTGKPALIAKELKRFLA